VTVYNYKEGDYFGEIALVRNIPRQASVKALTFTKIVSIERSAFKRVLGPIEDILRRNEDRYKKFWSCPVETNWFNLRLEYHLFMIE
jgi:cAMP-dependent protein kinase regulator